MADHISAALVVHACPPQHVRRVLDLIAEYGLTEGEDDGTDGFVLGVPYCAYDYAGGAADAVRDTLTADAPSVAFTTWYGLFEQDLGTLWVHVPELGTFTGACDDDGELWLPDRTIRAALAEDDPIAALHRARGCAWFDAAAGYEPDVRVREPRRYEVTWDRRRGVLYVDGAAEGGRDVEEHCPAAPVLSAAPEYPGADVRLSEMGFLRADDWTAPSGRMHSTEVYRASDCAVPE